MSPLNCHRPHRRRLLPALVAGSGHAQRPPQLREQAGRVQRHRAVCVRYIRPLMARHGPDEGAAGGGGSDPSDESQRAQAVHDESKRQSP